MNLPEFSIKKPVLIVMMSLALIIFGIIGYKFLSFSRLPDIQSPIISILTTYEGADPATIDGSITGPLENTVNGISGIKDIESISMPNVSIVTVIFHLDKNIDAAFNEVQARVNQAIPYLPKEIEQPVVKKIRIDSQPIMFVAVTGDRSLVELTNYANSYIKKSLETVDGVGSVETLGAQPRTIRVELDLNRLASFKITTEEVLNAFSEEYLQIAGGFIINKTTEHLLDLDLEFHSPEKLANLIVAYKDGLAIKLRDVGQVIDGSNPPRKLARVNGKPAVILAFNRSANGNTVSVIKEINRRIKEELIPTLPSGITLTAPLDDAEYIKLMVSSLTEHIWIGTFLASLVVWLFLRNIGSTLIIGVTIPISLFGAIFVMYLAGYTINIATLLALLLLIGIVVDDAIVILENIYTHQQRHTTNLELAAKSGAAEVMFAVLASTFTLVAIFAPVIFMSGIIGRFFESFAVVVTVGVIVSLFVSITLTPMLCARYLHIPKSRSILTERLEKAFIFADTYYLRILVSALHIRKTVIFISVLVCLLSFSLFFVIGKEFLPIDDEGRFMINVTTPVGSNIDYTNEKLKEVEKILSKEPDILNTITYISSFGDAFTNSAKIFVKLKPFKSRNVSEQTIIANLKKPLKNLDGVEAMPFPIPVVSAGDRGEPLQFSIQGPEFIRAVDYAKLLSTELEKNPKFGKIFLDINLNLPQYALVIDRMRAQSLGLTAAEIGRTMAVLGGGYDVAHYSDPKSNGERYKIRLAAKTGEVIQPEDLSQIYLKSQQGNLVRMDTVAHLEPISSPGKITHAHLQYDAIMYADPKISLGAAISLAQETAKKILPSDYHLVLLGQADAFMETAQVVKFTMLLAVILVYMVLASQFNSYVQPLIIMVAQPLAVAGALYALFLTHTTLNIFSMIGMILLMGLVAKNSILLIDLTNARRKKFKNLINLALLDACPQRMRPILMTSFTVILAMLPSALGIGVGADSNAPLAIAVIGGMVFSTFLTLILVPCVYSLVEHKLDEWRIKGKF